MKILVFSLLFLTLLLSTVLILDNSTAFAVKSIGNPKNAINSKNVCGDKLCDIKMSIQEKIALFMQTKSTTIEDQGRFQIGGVVQQEFEGIPAYVANPNFEVYGLIGEKWKALGAENSLLGSPVMNESDTRTKPGRFQNFQSGSIHWKKDAPAAFANIDSSPITQLWAAQTWEQGSLGFPLEDEQTPPDNVGHMQAFEGGHIYWHPDFGAHIIQNGQFWDTWHKFGYEAGDLGYPTGEQNNLSTGGTYQNFQRGVICISSNVIDVKIPGIGPDACNSTPPPVIISPPEPKTKPNYDIAATKGSSANINCADTCFSPSWKEIKPGDKTIFYNDDVNGHTFTSGTPAKGPDGKFDSGVIEPGGTFSYKFSDPGKYPYFDMVHPWMSGMIVVSDTPPTDVISSGTSNDSILKPPVVTQPNVITPDTSKDEKLKGSDTKPNGNDSLDKTAPDLFIGSDLFKETYDEGGIIVNFNVKASDSKDGIIEPTCDRTSGSLFPVGITKVTCSAKDRAGNITSKSFSTTVALLSPPSPILSTQAKIAGCHINGPLDRNFVNPAWAPAMPLTDWPMIAEGTVIYTQVSWDDFPWTHNTHDHNFDVVLDTSYEYLNSDKNSMSDDGRKRMMEMEWEYGDFPKEFWPEINDHVWMLGKWVFDCGHPPDYRTEIHPPYAVAFTRNEPTFFKNDNSLSDTTRMYFYVHNHGGYIDSQFLPVMQDYELDIHVPPNHSDKANLQAEEISKLDNNIFASPSFTYFPKENRVHVSFPLSPEQTTKVFNWNQIPGPDSEKLRTFLIQKFFNGNPHSRPNLDDHTPFSRPTYDDDLLDFTGGDIHKTDNGNTIQIGPKCVTANVQNHPINIYSICSSTMIRLDSSKTTAMITFQTDEPSKRDQIDGNYEYYFWRYSLIAKPIIIDNYGNTDLIISDYDHIDNFRYGSVIAAGWREPITTSDFRSLAIHFDSIKINDNHRNIYSCTIAQDGSDQSLYFIGTREFPPECASVLNCNEFGADSNSCKTFIENGAKWRFWVNANNHWIDVEPDFVEIAPNHIEDRGRIIHNNDVIPINKKVEVLVPEIGGRIHIGSTGWVSGTIDSGTFVRTELPSDSAGLGDSSYGFGVDTFCYPDFSNPCSTLPIGVIDKTHLSTDDPPFGIGIPHSESSTDYHELVPGVITNGDFTLNYHIEELGKFTKGTAN